jgi:hypothetical protein
VSLRVAWRPHVELDLDRVLGFEYVLGLRNIGAVLALDQAGPLGETAVKGYIRRRCLPILRPLAGRGFVACGKVISPLSQLLRWCEIYMERDWDCHYRPLTREEVE